MARKIELDIDTSSLKSNKDLTIEKIKNANFSRENTLDGKYNTIPLETEEFPSGGIPSFSSRGVFHRTFGAYLAELLMLNRFEGKLPSQFWLVPTYSDSYKGFMFSAQKKIKEYGFKSVHKAIVNNGLKDLRGGRITNLILLENN